jgi:hypothetical protein
MTESTEGRARLQGNRRLSLRSPLIVLKARIDQDKMSFFGYAKNISRGGMFISSINPREPGSQFRVEFPLPTPIDQRVQCDCEVVWKRIYSPKAIYEPGMGLKFLNLPEEIAEAIDAWINSLV